TVAWCVSVSLAGYWWGVAEGGAARDDRDLVHRQQVAGQVRHDSVARLVVGQDPALLLRKDFALLQSRDDALHRVLEIRLVDLGRLQAAGEHRRLVGDTLAVRAGQARRVSSDRAQVDVIGERLPAGMHAEDVLAAGQVGCRYEHLPVEAPR